MRKELFSPLRIYSDTEKRYSNLKKRFEESNPYQESGVDFCLLSLKTSFLPFVFLRNPSSSGISSIKVMSSVDDSEVFVINSGLDSIIKIFQIRDSSETVTDDLIFYNGVDISGMNLTNGHFYLKITDGDSTEFFSEDFFSTDQACKAYRLRWWNNTDFDYFPFSQGFIHTLYLESELIEAEYPLDDDGVEDGQKNFKPTFQKVTKRYKLRGDLLPEYLVDALSIVPLHGNFTISREHQNTHVENLTGENIEFEIVESVPLNRSVELTFKIDEIINRASNQNLNINKLITSETTYSLSTGFSNQFDACNNIGTPTPTNYYSEDSTLVVGSLIYNTTGNNTNLAPTGWYRDSSNGRAIHIDSSGEIDQFFTCITEYTYNLVGEEGTDALACASVDPESAFYSTSSSLVVTDVLYTVSQNVTSYASDGFYMHRGTDNIYEVSGGAGAITAITTPCTETIHALTSGFATDTAACAGASSPTNYYSRDAVLIVGSRIYTTTHVNNSFVAAGAYKDAVNDNAIVVGSNGEITSITDCSLSEYSHLVMGSYVDSTTACNASDPFTTVYSTDPTIIVGSVVYTTSGSPTSYLGNGFYQYGGGYIEITGGAGVVNSKGTCVT